MNKLTGWRSFSEYRWISALNWCTQEILKPLWSGEKIFLGFTNFLSRSNLFSLTHSNKLSGYEIRTWHDVALLLFFVCLTWKMKHLLSPSMWYSLLRAKELHTQTTHTHKVAYKACEGTYLSNSLGGLRGRETVHWLWQMEEFIAGSAIHTWLRSLAVWAASLWHLYDTLSTWCRLQLKRSVSSMRTGWVCVCLRAFTICVNVFVFFEEKEACQVVKHGNVSVGVSHCVGYVEMCGYMFVHANVCALSVQTALFALQGVVLREINWVWHT